MFQKSAKDQCRASSSSKCSFYSTCSSPGLFVPFLRVVARVYSKHQSDADTPHHVRQQRAATAWQMIIMCIRGRRVEAVRSLSSSGAAGAEALAASATESIPSPSDQKGK
jgi:hypothetical protein